MPYYIMIKFEDSIKKILACILIVASIFMSSDIILADTSGGDEFGDKLCQLIKRLQGGTARAIATVAIFALGVSLFMGKLNWPAALTIAIGILGVFSAQQILDMIAPGTGGAC